jgi:hypothetical protein
MSTRSKSAKSQIRTENENFSVAKILSRKKSNPDDLKELIETTAKVLIDGSNAGSKQTLDGFNAANEENKKYKNLVLFVCVGLWAFCESICLAILYIPSASVGDGIKNLAATAAIQTLPSIAFGFIAGKSTE